VVTLTFVLLTERLWSVGLVSLIDRLSSVGFGRADMTLKRSTKRTRTLVKNFILPEGSMEEACRAELSVSILATVIE
jgi:hypothetical protein